MSIKSLDCRFLISKYSFLPSLFLVIRLGNFLVAIVMLVVVKENISIAYGLGGLMAFVVLLMSAIKIYKSLREKKG